MPFWKISPSLGGGNRFPVEDKDIGESLAGIDSPKMKYAFTIQLFPRADVSLSETGSDDMAEMKFSLKTADRPKPTSVFADINYYNFRTKVAHRMDYGQLNVSFYDDLRNRAHDVLHKYLEAVSPVSRLSKSNADLLDRLGQTSSASIGPLSANRHGPFQAVRITHHYLVDNVVRKIHYDYLNPKIINYGFDDLDMSISDVTIISISFVYDSVNIIRE